MNILIIDDEPRICLILKKFLEKKGHIVDVINDPLELLSGESKKEYDVICVDINMPCMTGDVVVRLLESRGVESEIFIITGMEDKLIDFLDLKYYTIIKKPFSLSEIEEIFNNVANRRGKK